MAAGLIALAVGGFGTGITTRFERKQTVPLLADGKMCLPLAIFRQRGASLASVGRKRPPAGEGSLIAFGAEREAATPTVTETITK